MLGNIFKCNEKTMAVRVIARNLGIKESRVVGEIRDVVS